MTTTMVALNSPSIRYSEFIRLTLPSATYTFCSAASPITVNGVTYTGLGDLLSISNISQNVKSTSQDLSISLTGIDGSNVGMVLSADIKGSVVEVWRGFLDDNNQIINSASNNLLLYSQLFDNSVWTAALNGITSRIPNSAIAPDGTNTATKIVFSGASDPYIGQSVNAGETIAGKTFTFSIWAWTNTGQPNTLYELYIYNPTVSFVGQLTLPTLTTTPTRYEFTYTFPVGATGNEFFVRFDGRNSPPPPANSFCFIWGAQAEKNSSASSYVPTTTNQQFATQQFFKRYQGIVNNVNIQEGFNDEMRTRIATCTIACASFKVILQNRIAGQKTTPTLWQNTYANDTSMNRVPVITAQYFDFGKDPKGGGQATPSTPATYTSGTFG
jgi:hypothetical protein